MTPFKVCCIQSAEEADMALAAGASAIGLVGPMPSGDRQIEDERIRDIAAHVRARYGGKVWTALLTSRTEGDAIADHVAATGVNTVQIVDTPAPGAHDAIRKAHPGLRIIQVIHVEGENAIGQALDMGASADAIILDSGKPSATVKTFGGTGAVHDWSISERIVRASARPVFLAGGLTPDNVGAAMAAVRPFGVDICSGLRDKERGNALNRQKLAAFAACLGGVRS